MSRSNAHWNVAPRYTPGWPAPVDERTAWRVAAEESDAYQDICAGICGDAQRRRAIDLGLAGIVEYREERAEGWIVDDIITGERFFRVAQDYKQRTPDQARLRIFRLRSKYHVDVR